MSEVRLIPVYSSTDVGRCEVIRATLEAEGIPCEIENEHQAGMTGVFEVRLFVRDVDEAAARAFITEHEQPVDEPPPALDETV
ncbi:MAG: DUF2007 domain-containing protein [Planctomycetaceae bacterium]|nr:DUF2007 domain-containing protein [Planctomycetaceae bacterium]